MDYYLSSLFSPVKPSPAFSMKKISAVFEKENIERIFSKFTSIVNQFIEYVTKNPAAQKFFETVLL